MSAIIEWAEPTPKQRVMPTGRKSRFTDALSALRAHPDKWARVTEEPLEGTKAQSHAARIRNGLVVDVEPGEFDATDDQGHLFVRFLGAQGAKEWAEAKAKRDAAKAERARKAAEAGEAAPVEDDDDENIPDPDEDETNEHGAHEATETVAPAAEAAPVETNEAFGW